MDIKELVKKVVEGGNADEITKTLDPKQQSDFYTELASQRKIKADEELAIIEARRKESGKIKTETDSVLATAEVKIRSQMRGEQIDIAFNKASDKLKDKGITLSLEEITKLKEDFKVFDSGKFDSTLIEKDVLRAYAANNAEKLIEASSRIMSSEYGAAQFNAGSAGAGATGGGTASTKEYAPEVMAAVRAGQKFGISLTPEEAERGLKAGGDWKNLQVKDGKNARGAFSQIS